jgi:hypothetical protein
MKNRGVLCVRSRLEIQAGSEPSGSAWAGKGRDFVFGIRCVALTFGGRPALTGPFFR